MPLTDRDYDLLSDYIDDALTPGERRAVESRLAADAEYRDELAALRQTVALVKSLPGMIAPRDLRLTQKTAATIVAELTSKPYVARARTPAVRLLTTFAAAAASLALVLAGTVSLLRPETIPPTVAVADVRQEAMTASAAFDGDETTLGMMTAPDMLTPAADDTMMTDELQEENDPAADLMSMEMGEDTMGTLQSFEDAPPTQFDEPPASVQFTAPADEADMAGSSMAAVPQPTQAPPSAANRSALEATDTAPGEEESAQQRASASTATAATTDVMLAAPTGTPALSATVELPAPTEPLDTLRTQQDGEGADTRERDDVPDASDESVEQSPLAGFALVIAGVVLGVATMIAWTRRG
jgi:hypothetical protein